MEEFTIPDGYAEIALPIEVSPPRIVINGSAPPRIIQVNCSVPDGEYGAGEEINITVLFTTRIVWRPKLADFSDTWVGSSVDVPQRWVLSNTEKRMLGPLNTVEEFNSQWARGVHPSAQQKRINASQPTIRLATGCRRQNRNCFIPEIQTFHCKANKGALALSWNGHTVRNLDASLDQEELKSALETIPGNKGAFSAYCIATCHMTSYRMHGT